MFRYLGLLLLLLTVCSCAKNSESPPISEPDYLVHRIEYSGETLGIIAAWYTGRSANWQLLVASNPELDPRRMRIGDYVRIPEELLVRSEPVSETFVKRLSVDSASVQASSDDLPSTQSGTSVVDQDVLLGDNATELAGSSEPVTVGEGLGDRSLETEQHYDLGDGLSIIRVDAKRPTSGEQSKAGTVIDSSDALSAKKSSSNSAELDRSTSRAVDGNAVQRPTRETLLKELLE